MYKKSYKGLACLLVLVFAVAAFSGAFALAQEQTIDEDISKSIGDLEVHEGITVNGDVGLNIGSAVIMGLVNGDVSADMGEVSVSGKVNGDVKAEMGKVVIDGDVTGNVTATMGEIIVNGSVGGDLKSNLGAVRVTGTVAGDVISDLGDVNIAGEVGGNVEGESNKITVNGIVDGDIKLDRGAVELGNDSVVRGTVFVNEGKVTKSEGAQAGAVEVVNELTSAELHELITLPGGISFRGLDNITDIFRDRGFWRNISFEMPRFVPFVEITGMGILGRILQKFSTMIILFALGVLVYTLFPRQVTRVREALEKNTGPVALWGVIALLVAVPLIILLVITIIGIPLILVQILAYGVAWILGYTAITLLLGGRILEAAKSESDNPLIKILIGVAILGLVSFIPVLGVLVSIAVLIMALGSSVFTRFGTDGLKAEG